MQVQVVGSANQACLSRSGRSWAVGGAHLEDTSHSWVRSKCHKFGTAGYPSADSNTSVRCSWNNWRQASVNTGQEEAKAPPLCLDTAFPSTKQSNNR